MAVAKYEASFSAVMPVLRDREKIVADRLAPAPSATGVTKAKVAEIELHVADGEAAFEKGSYAAALYRFKTARGLIYQVLYPAFDVDFLITSRVDVALPSGAGVERQLLDTSLRLVEGIRPKLVERSPIFALAGDVDGALEPFVKVGFRESITADASLQLANVQGVGLLAEGKPAAAAALLGDAVKVARGSDNVDLGITAGTTLNLAAALLESSRPAEAFAAAEEALQLFTRQKDIVGQAQAVHTAAVAAERQGKEETAKRLLAKAAHLLKDMNGKLHPKRDPRMPAPRRRRPRTPRVSSARAACWSGRRSASSRRRRSTISGPSPRWIRRSSPTAFPAAPTVGAASS